MCNEYVTRAKVILHVSDVRVIPESEEYVEFDDCYPHCRSLHTTPVVRRKKQGYKVTQGLF